MFSFTYRMKISISAVSKLFQSSGYGLLGNFNSSSAFILKIIGESLLAKAHKMPLLTYRIFYIRQEVFLI